MSLQDAPAIVKGRLSPDELATVEQLSQRGWKAGRIAQKLNRHPGTINFAMHSMGLKAPKPIKPFSCVRKNGVVVHSFDAAEDAMLESTRLTGAVCREIAEASLAQFGRKRSAATINIRLKMLANKAEGASDGR
jgi:hypothetical protein